MFWNLPVSIAATSVSLPSHNNRKEHIQYSGAVTQPAEYLSYTQLVVGSIPTRPIYERRGHMVIPEKNVRKGIYKGKIYKFTNWNPKTNEVWADNYPAGKDSLGLPVYGKWIHRDKVHFL